MQYMKGIDSRRWEEATAVTLGKFDGLHRGHQMLVDKIREYGKQGCPSVLCAFDMGRDSLMTKEERRRRLEGQIDYLVDYPFTTVLREMPAEAFITGILKDTLHAAHIVVGTDFSFGYEKRGDITMLRQFSKTCGFTVDVIEKKKYRGRVISSTYVREALAAGNAGLAARLLGYPYEVTGIVEHGKRLGRTLGFPTMNIEPEANKILPRYGVYACRVRIRGHWYNGIGNAGIKPTVTNEKKRLLEVYVYGYQGDAYGQEISVQFVEFVRPETRFHSVEELKEQVMRDMEFGERYFGRNG